MYTAPDFKLKPRDKPIKTLDRPVASSKVSRLWLEQDTKFRIPKAYISLCLRSAEADKSAKNLCLTDCYVLALRHLADEIDCPAELRDGIHVFDRGLTMHLHGFSDGLLSLFLQAINNIAALQLSDDLLVKLLSEISDVYSNKALCPAKLNKDLQKSLLLTSYSNVLQKIDFVNAINMDNLVKFSKDFYNGIFAEMLVQGNMTAKESTELLKHAVARLQCKAASNPETLAQTLVTKLPVGHYTYKIVNKNTKDESSTLSTYYQFSVHDLHSQVLNELIVTNMQEAATHQLRTVKQLSYDVHISHKPIFGVVGFSIAIRTQASKFSLDDIDDQIEAFLAKYCDAVQKMTQARFETLVSTVMNDKNLTSSNLEEEFNSNWEEVIEQTYQFDSYKEIAELKSVTLQQLKNWGQEELLPNAGRRKLSVQVIGRNQVAKPRDYNINQYQITDIDRFKSHCEKHKFSRRR